MKILFLTGRESTYARNQVMSNALQKLGRVDVLPAPQTKSILTRSTTLALQALPLLLTKKYDLIFVGFYGHFLMQLAGRISKSPVLFDAFISTFDTFCSDRAKYSPNSIQGKLAFWLDKSACHLASHVLVDTPLHASYFTSTFNIAEERISAVPVGCPENLFKPIAASRIERTDVLFYCTYLPLHGVDIVIQSAQRLSEYFIRFRIIGHGPTYGTISAQAQGIKTITFAPPVPLEALSEEISNAAICLGGHFGASEKAGRVVPGKIYQLMAMEKAIIAADSPANRQLLEANGEPCAILIPPQDPTALATAILTLYNDPLLRIQLGKAARKRYLDCCSEERIANQLNKIVKGICA